MCFKSVSQIAFDSGQRSANGFCEEGDESSGTAEGRQFMLQTEVQDSFMFKVTRLEAGRPRNRGSIPS